jgi:Arc/MetJ family transcription regulator
MTTTVDIPEDVLRRAMLASGTASAQEAVVKALEEFVRRHDQRTLIPLLGTFQDFMTPEELDEMRRSE